MSVDEIEWAEPPADKRRRDYTGFADKLRARPGHWAKWPQSYRNTNSVGAIRKNISDGNQRAPVPFREGKWQAVVRSSTLYVRYLGETETEAQKTLAQMPLD